MILAVIYEAKRPVLALELRLSLGQIQSASDPRIKTAIDSLEGAGFLTSEGGGTINDPYRYTVTPRGLQYMEYHQIMREYRHKKSQMKRGKQK